MNNTRVGSIRHGVGHIGALGLLAAALASCSSADETLIANGAREEGSVNPPLLGTVHQGLGLITIIGRVVTGNDVGTPGVRIVLAGPTPGAAVTDANGLVRFAVPPGEYSLGPEKAGARFSPRLVSPNGDGDEFVTFECTGGCDDGTTVAVDKSLLITHPSVLADTRASNAGNGPWSFRFMIEQMAPPEVDPADFARAWLEEFSLPDTFNGFAVEQRNLPVVLGLWPTTPEGKLDLARAPFQLLAIVNRTDLHATSNGELRFVYGLVDADGIGRSMSVIFEFALPSRDLTGADLNRLAWVRQFKALADVDFGEDYNTNLQGLTDRVTRRGSDPARPGGSAISQVRSNEIEMGGAWQLREFHLDGDGPAVSLRLAPPAMTPDDVHLNLDTPENDAIADYINGNAVEIRGGFATVPSASIGGQSSVGLPWQFSKTVDERARRSFAGQTCSGCHAVETAGLQIDGFYQISPTSEGGSDGTDRVSQFIKTIEVPRRTGFMKNQLSCSGSDCAPGAEAIFF